MFRTIFTRSINPGLRDRYKVIVKEDNNSGSIVSYETVNLKEYEAKDLFRNEIDEIMKRYPGSEVQHNDYLKIAVISNKEKNYSATVLYRRQLNF